MDVYKPHLSMKIEYFEYKPARLEHILDYVVTQLRTILVSINIA
jgi:hypothetical protein